jgi:hypothetical protein
VVTLLPLDLGAFPLRQRGEDLGPFPLPPFLCFGSKQPVDFRVHGPLHVRETLPWHPVEPSKRFQLLEDAISVALLQIAHPMVATLDVPRREAIQFVRQDITGNSQQLVMLVKCDGVLQQKII